MFRFVLFAVVLCVVSQLAAAVAPPTQEMKELLEEINQVRAYVGAKPLTWNHQVTELANSWAHKCHWEHDLSGLHAHGWGENLASQAPFTTDIHGMYAGWYTGECEKYVRAGCPAISGSNFEAFGHYTQLIWHASKEIGCGYADCSVNSPFGSSFPHWTMLVCDFAPAGNYIGQRPGHFGCNMAICRHHPVVHMVSSAGGNGTTTGASSSGSSSSASSSDSLPAWAVAVIICGCVFAAALLAIAVIVVMRRRQAVTTNVPASTYLLQQ